MLRLARKSTRTCKVVEARCHGKTKWLPSSCSLLGRFGWLCFMRRKFWYAVFFFFFFFFFLIKSVFQSNQSCYRHTTAGGRVRDKLMNLSRRGLTLAVNRARRGTASDKLISSMTKVNLNREPAYQWE